MSTCIAALKIWTICLVAGVLAGCAGQIVDASPAPQLFQASSTVSKATPQEVADFWDQVFNGPSPYGIPPLNATRSNQRVIGDVTVWDVTFDSYRDPDTNQPVRLGGLFAIPKNITAPGPGGTFPGLVVTHSVGVLYPQPDNLEEMATFFAQKGYAALAFYVRSYGTSTMANLDANASDCSNSFCANLVGEGEAPFDTIWAGIPVDTYQAGEFLAAQPEVWDPNKLAFIGHSLGGYAALHAGIFSPRYSVIAASAPAVTSPDLDAWMNYWRPSGWWDWANSQPDPAQAMSLFTRMWSFTGAYPALNNPALIAKNSAWKLDNSEIWLYGGQTDPAVPPWDVEAAYLLLDNSNNKAFHWSPTGAHGGPESWDRAQAWLAGHYPGQSQSPPTADIQVVSTAGRTVTFSGSGSSDDDIMVAWDYDFDDGTTKNWGDTVSHTYTGDGTYDVTLTVTDGAGLRASDTIQVVIGQAGSNPELLVTADDPIVVPEGETNTFTVALTDAPDSSVQVNIDRASGSSDIAVQSGAVLDISTQNWYQPHTVTLAVAEDGDASPDAAVFSVSSPGMSTVNVNVVTADDDATSSLLMILGSTSGQSGSTVSIPITISNPGKVPITDFAITLSYDGDILIDADATKGAAIPGSAWWTFSATPSNGVLVIEGNEFVPPPNAVIDGVLANVEFTIDNSAVAGSYTVNAKNAVANGTSTPQTTAGTVIVTSADPSAGRTYLPVLGKVCDSAAEGT